jgi:CHAT domain-containing protein
MEQARPSDMLFCLHHQLRHAHQEEWPAIEKIVRQTPGDRFSMLGPLCVSEVCDGDTFLAYLDRSTHNMVHFACHCRPGEAGADSLIVSLLRPDEDHDPSSLELETYDFIDVEGVFRRKPLVFLNACQSSGGPDDLRKTFNLPQVFIERGAAAVVATVCPVPDLFAASFARHFYHHFLRGHMTIGQALRVTRRHFIEGHHNPLALAYGLYSPAFYQVARSPIDVQG